MVSKYRACFFCDRDEVNIFLVKQHKVFANSIACCRVDCAFYLIIFGKLHNFSQLWSAFWLTIFFIILLISLLSNLSIILFFILFSVLMVESYLFAILKNDITVAICKIYRSNVKIFRNTFNLIIGVKFSLLKDLKLNVVFYLCKNVKKMIILAVLNVPDHFTFNLT